ncbi:MAG: permease [Azonexus sp.]|nr:permease [Azonexus sp.]
MEYEIDPGAASGPARAGWRTLGLLAWMLALSACMHAPPPPPAKSQPPIEQPKPIEPPGFLPPLAYYQTLEGMSAAQLAREQSLLAALPSRPAVLLCRAMVIGHPRGQADAARALALVEQTLRDNDPAAQELHGLARLLADDYNERLRLDAALERQGQQLKESQRRAQELKEKLDGLADIERSLTPRARSRTGQGETP